MTSKAAERSIMVVVIDMVIDMVIVMVIVMIIVMSRTGVRASASPEKDRERVVD